MIASEAEKTGARIMRMFGVGPYHIAWLFGRGESTIKYWLYPKFRKAQLANQKRYQSYRRK
jgi:hypothetical protein